jgi:hypothetical protein
MDINKDQQITFADIDKLEQCKSLLKVPEMKMEIEAMKAYLFK